MVLPWLKPCSSFRFIHLFPPLSSLSPHSLFFPLSVSLHLLCPLPLWVSVSLHLSQSVSAFPLSSLSFHMEHTSPTVRCAHLTFAASTKPVPARNLCCCQETEAQSPGLSSLTSEAFCSIHLTHSVEEGTAAVGVIFKPSNTPVQGQPTREHQASGLPSPDLAQLRAGIFLFLLETFLAANPL